MEEVKPKKERKFLKAMGDIALVLFRELVLGIGKKVINKVGNKRQGLAIAFVMVAGISYAAIDSIPYPITGNKQRLGWQTTGNGLVYRGTASDTVTKPSNYTNKDIKAYLLVDTVNNVMYSYIASKGGWQFNNSDTVIIQGATMPFDSITFNTTKDGTVGVGEVEYNDTQGSLIQGLKGGNVTNVIGQQLHQRVNNRTGAALNKGDVVYLSGSQGNRITVAKALATSDPTSANTFGIVAESIADNQSGYIITEGLITGLNTSALTQDSAVYLSGTTAGALTSTKPQAPIHGVYIGVCVKTNAGSGEVFVKIRNGQELDELHDVQITSPVDKASLYYKGSEGLWRDTTAALLVSDTSSMLTNYLRTGVAANTYLPLTGGTISGTINRQEGSHDGIASTFYYNILNYFAKRDNNKGGQTAQITFTDRPGTSTFENNVRTSDIYLMTAKNFSGGQLGQYLDTTLSIVANQDGGRVGISKLNPSYKLDVNGTLGVSGPSTFLDLQGTGSRMVVAGSGGLLSTQAIPTGTVTSVGGTGTVNGITLTGTVTSSGNLTLGGTLSGVSLSSQVTGTLPIANGGTGATTAANARTNLGATVRGANTFLLTDIGAISFLRYNADNTVSQRAADGMRSDLGGTTIGQSMFTLTNPSAVTFPRFNADNTISSLSATDFRTAIGAGTGNGNGTVTNVTGTLPISVANGTTTPSITIANASTTASGVVTTGTQSMAGNKTFTGDLATSQAFSATGFSTLTGGASIGTMATESTLTHVLGVNSSNAIGELGLGVGMSVGSGILSVQAAGSSQSGLVTSTTQSFGGNKTFTGTIKTDKYIAVSGVTVITGNYTILDTDTYIVCNGSGTITLTMPSGSAHTGREITIKTTQLFTVISNASNIIGMQNSSITSTGILPATDGAWGTFVYDGTNWMQMAAGVPNQ